VTVKRLRETIFFKQRRYGETGDFTVKYCSKKTLIKAKFLLKQPIKNWRVAGEKLEFSQRIQIIF
ncbi:TPA: hypothetical protein ACHW42_004078, partial [Shigella flexneri 2a]